MPKIITPAQNWADFIGFLPEGWIAKCRELKALVRYRKFRPESLLRVLFIHLVKDLSLRQTVAKAEDSGLAKISIEALQKRLCRAAEWFRWMTVAVLESTAKKRPKTAWLPPKYRIRVIDGTTVQEPGSKGTNWRVHMSMSYPSMDIDEVLVTDAHIGESFERYKIRPGDICIGDINYATVKGIRHVRRGGGFTLVRLNLFRLRFFTLNRKKFVLMPWLRELGQEEVGEIDVKIKTEAGWISGRVCAKRRSPEAARKAQEKVIKAARKKGHEPRPETVEAAAYFYVFTTLPRKEFRASKVLLMYRVRWHVELLFKRLKSLLGLGHLKKYDPESARAWIQGKLLIAVLLMAMQQAGEGEEDFFFSTEKFQRHPAEYLDMA
jgi:hypothetical protein